MQITALSLGLTKHLSNILEDETANAVGGPQVHPDVKYTKEILKNTKENSVFGLKLNLVVYLRWLGAFLRS